MIHLTTVYDQNCPQKYYDKTHHCEVDTCCGTAYDQIISQAYFQKFNEGKEREIMITRLGGLSGRAPVETWIADVLMIIPSKLRGFSHIVYNNARKIETYRGPIHRNHKQLTENAPEFPNGTIDHR